uniref:Uncharacterized protein n=1 Tax=Rhizophora mucronata TaxID=61149 RepID=A0A2P2QWE3_RHIMU
MEYIFQCTRKEKKKTMELGWKDVFLFYEYNQLKQPLTFMCAISSFNSLLK